MPFREMSSNNSRPVTLSGNFTEQELSRLVTLRHNYTVHAEYLERVIDARRLEFARWLLEHGKLSEDAPHS